MLIAQVNRIFWFAAVLGLTCLHQQVCGKSGDNSADSLEHEKTRIVESIRSKSFGDVDAFVDGLTGNFKDLKDDSDYNYAGSDTDEPEDKHQSGVNRPDSPPNKSRKLFRFCSNPYTLDFDISGDGTPLQHGDLVLREWKKPYGIRIKAVGKNGGGYTPDGAATIFNSNSPGKVTELGSPNYKCGLKGPGKGSGGYPNKLGANCEQLGNVLIIQDSGVPYYPKDFPDGGKIIFYFDKPTTIISVGLLDINTSSTRIKISKADNSRKTIKVPRLGNNSFQRVDIGHEDVKKLEVSLKNFGAVTSLTFCTDVCVPREVLSFEDFEDGSYAGWKNGKIDYEVDFTTFLGRFIKHDNDPIKTYTVPKDAVYIIFELDFYEIDSWNKKVDCVYLYVNGERTLLGFFGSSRDEGTRSGTSDNGVITWNSASKAKPSHIGFRGGSSNFKDQIHHVKVIIPYQLFADDGKLEVRIETAVSATSNLDESGGYDNIKLTAIRDCGVDKPQLTPAPTPRPTPKPTNREVGRICGVVQEDTNNDDQPDGPLENVLVDLKEDGDVVASRRTDEEGKYCFRNVEPGSYTVVQINRPGFIDVLDSDEGDPSAIDVEIGNGNPLNSNNNDFLDEALRFIAGRVLEDTDDDGIGELGIHRATVQLVDNDGSLIDTDETDRNGSFLFEDITPGVYFVREVTPPGFDDVNDSDGGDPNEVEVNVETGNEDGVFFTDVRIPPTPQPTPATPRPTPRPSNRPTQAKGKICGRVEQDINNDNIPDDGLSDVLLRLQLTTAQRVIASIRTDENGDYCFEDIPAGSYLILQRNLPGFTDVLDSDGDDPNEISVTIGIDSNPISSFENNFLDAPLRTILGRVLEDINGDTKGDVPIRGVTVRLIDAAGDVSATDATNSNGMFVFRRVPPGEYTVREVTPPGFDDVTDSDGGNPNRISVDFTQGDETGLFFVDVRVAAPPTPRPTPYPTRRKTPRPTPRLTARPTCPPIDDSKKESSSSESDDGDDGDGKGDSNSDSDSDDSKSIPVGCPSGQSKTKSSSSSEDRRLGDHTALKDEKHETNEEPEVVDEAKMRRALRSTG